MEKLSDDEQELVESQVNFNKHLLKDREKANKRPKKYGICGMCLFFHYFITIYEKEHACCAKLRIRLSTIDRIKDCIDFNDFSLPSIYEMTQIATILDPKKPDKIGFHK